MLLPEALTRLDQWVTWKPEERGGRITKVPVNLHSGRWASTTDPSTWSDYETAAWLADRFHGGRLGFVFTREARIVGVDLDHVITDGQMDPKAERIVEELQSYTEISPSGTGLHLFIRADWNDSGRRGGGWLEVYSERRFFTMTGNHLDGTPLTVEERTTELEAIRQRELPQPPHP